MILPLEIWKRSLKFGYIQIACLSVSNYPRATADVSVFCGGIGILLGVGWMKVREVN